MIELTCFRIYDVRSETDVHIEDGIAYRVDPAVAQRFNAKSVVIGFDARETSVCDRDIEEWARMS